LGKKGKTAIYVAALSIVCGLIIWHTIQWHLSGMHLEMFSWLQTGRGYITVLYNLGLMLALGIGLGFLMDKITDLIGYEVRRTKHPGDEAETSKGQ
jgi:hypothetical protein